MGNRQKFTAQIGECASMEKVTGKLEIREKNGNVTLSVLASDGFYYDIHEFFPISSIGRSITVTRGEISGDIIVQLG